MDENTLIRISGLISILAGILNILSAMPGQIPENTLTWVRRGADICALIALVGIYLHQRKDTATFGLIAFIVAVTGVMMLIFSFRYEHAIIVYALGVLMVSISILRTGSFPGWVPLLWFLSVLVALPGLLLPDLETLFSLLAAISFALGFVGVGYYLLTPYQG